MSISIFQIPHLREEIALNLSQSDLARCTLVSKEWNSWFISTLWFNLKYRRSISKNDLSALQSHSYLVRSIYNLQLSSKLIISSDLFVYFPRIHSLQLSIEADNDTSLVSTALNIVSESTTLQYFDFTLSDYAHHEQLIYTLRSHPRLTTFAFKCKRYIHVDQLQEVIEACVKLEQLTFTIFLNPAMLKQGSSAKDAITKTRFQEMQDTKIRKLSFITEISSFPQDSFLSCLLERCPILEDLSLTGRFSVQTMRSITCILKQGVILPLKSLTLENISNSFADAEDLGALIQSIGSSISDSSSPNKNNDSNSDDNNNGNRGLETLTIGNRAPFGRPALSALARCHSNTLTTLIWPQLTSLHLSFFADIVQALPRLQTLKARVWLNLRVKDGPDMDALFQKQWNCLELTDLDIDLGLSCTFDTILDPSWKGSLSDRCLSYAFSQIARLVKLKRLRIRSEVELLTLRDEGYLRLVSSLKQIQALHFDRWSENDMGSKEAKWMVENWPNLSRVAGHWRLWSSRTKGSDGKSSDEFSQTLSCLRKWIRISCS